MWACVSTLDLRLQLEAHVVHISVDRWKLEHVLDVTDLGSLTATWKDRLAERVGHVI